MGMCGGPVLANEDNELRCVGVDAAVVLPKQNPNPDSRDFFDSVRDNALCIDTRPLISFLKHIEQLPQQ
jgi:hypothetical protein